MGRGRQGFCAYPSLRRASPLRLLRRVVLRLSRPSALVRRLACASSALVRPPPWSRIPLAPCGRLGDSLPAAPRSRRVGGALLCRSRRLPDATVFAPPRLARAGVALPWCGCCIVWLTSKLFASSSAGLRASAPAQSPRGCRVARGWGSSAGVRFFFHIFCYTTANGRIVWLTSIVRCVVWASPPSSAPPSKERGACGCGRGPRHAARLRGVVSPRRGRNPSLGHGAKAPLGLCPRHSGVRFAGFFVSMRRVLRCHEIAVSLWCSSP